MKKQKLIFGLVALMGLFIITGCEKESEGMKPVADMTIAEYALSDNNFSILVQALTKAELVNVLNGTGNFTVFAPTNAAFESLFATLGVSGIADLTAAQLVPILTYHVVSGNVLSTQLQAGDVETLNGTISVTLSPVPTINGSSKIVATDVQASNGVIHVIDQVLLP